MENKKIQQIKVEIEGLISEAKQKALKSGVSLNSPVLAKKINELKTKLLKKFGISKEQYDNVEALANQEDIAGKIKTKEQIKQDIQEALDEENFRKDVVVQLQNQSATILKIQRDIIASNIALVKIDRGVKAFKPFNQDEITDLNPSQIKGYAVDRREIDQKFYEAAVFRRELEGALKDRDKVFAGFNQRITDIENEKRIEFHNDLKGIGPDDHHPQLHTLESHLESDLMKKLLYLASPTFLRDIYSHSQGIQSGIIDIAGITQNDADARYVQISTQGTQVIEEVPTGLVDGLNVTFVLAETPIAGTAQVFVNGARMTVTAGDYTISSATITMASAPPTGSIIIVDYRY